jgi:hypothetical protein
VGSLLHLHDAHERAQLLLPWHASGTLDAPELALLEAHLAECAECRADLEAERKLRADFASMPMPHRAGIPRAIRIPARARPRLPGRRRFLARRVAVGWALAPAAVAAAAAVFLLLPQAQPEPAAGYRLLGSEDAHPAGNVIVLFAPDTTEQQLRAALMRAGARLVDGPTASGAYIVRVPAAERPAALAGLRAMDGVVLAEPVDPGAAP